MTSVSQLSLLSNDIKIVKIYAKLAKKSDVLNEILETCGNDKCDIFPLRMFTAAVLRKVFEWVQHHMETRQEEDDGNLQLSQWDETFFRVGQKTVIEIVKVVNFLGIPTLVTLSYIKMANRLNDESNNKAREMLNHPNNDKQSRIRKIPPQVHQN